MTNGMMIVPRSLAVRAARFARVVVAAGLLGIGLAACAAGPRENPPSYGDWRASMGENVDRVRFSHLVDWQALDREWVMLEFSDGRRYAVEVRDPCITDAREAGRLELETAMKNTLHHSDRIHLDRHRCLIETIREMAPGSWRNRYRGSVSASRGD